MKRGIFTSEFWLTAAPTIFAMLNESGIVGAAKIPTENLGVVFCAIIVYAITRGFVKTSFHAAANNGSLPSLQNNTQKGKNMTSKFNTIIAASISLLGSPAIKKVVENLETEAAVALAGDVNKMVLDPAEREAGAQLAGGLAVFFGAVKDALEGPVPVVAPIPSTAPAPAAAPVQHETTSIPSTHVDGKEVEAKTAAEAAAASSAT